MSKKVLFSPIIESTERERIRVAALARWHDNVAMAAAFEWPIDPERYRRDIEHYMTQCAIAIELFSKNYVGLRQLGSERHDFMWFGELRAEIGRQQNQLDHLTTQGGDANQKSAVARKLRLHKKLLRLVCGDSTARFDTAADIETTLEFFFECIAMFPMLRIMLAREKPEGLPVCFTRLPTHCAVPQRKMFALCQALESLAHERRHNTNLPYMERIRTALIAE